MFGHALGDGAADAARGAGDDGDFSGHVKQGHAFLSPSSDLIRQRMRRFASAKQRSRDRTTTVTSCEFAGSCDFRPRGLMHGIVRGVGDPWLLVDHRHPPAAMTRACEMIEPRHRAVVDGEGEPPLRLVAESEPNCRLDSSAMRYRYHVLAGIFGADTLDRAAHAIVKIHETFAARRGFIDRRKPVAADLDRPVGKECCAVQPLPFAEMLFGQRGLVPQMRGFWKSGRPDRGGGLMRSLEMARVPDRVARQNLSDRLKHDPIAGVAADVLLSVDAAAILAHRSVTHPPPSRSHHAGGNGMLQNERLVWIGHRKDPSILLRLLRQSTVRLK